MTDIVVVAGAILSIVGVGLVAVEVATQAQFFGCYPDDPVRHFALFFGGGAALIVLGGHLMGMFDTPVAMTTTCTWTNTSAGSTLFCPKP